MTRLLSLEKTTDETDEIEEDNNGEELISIMFCSGISTKDEDEDEDDDDVCSGISTAKEVVESEEDVDVDVDDDDE